MKCADGNRLRKTVVSGGPVPTQTMVKDVYQAGRIAYETDGAGTTLATFSYDPNGAPESVVVGSDPTTGPRYYYVYNTHGDVVALVDASGNLAARYSYDEFGTITDSSETFANGWTNPYRYDGMDRVRYDSETGLYWMSVRAYDPALGRFLSRDPEGRTPLVFATQPYAYAGNNPLRNIDPSGQRYFDLSHPDVQAPPFGAPHTTPGVTTMPGSPPSATGSPTIEELCYLHLTQNNYASCASWWGDQQKPKRDAYLSSDVQLANGFWAAAAVVKAVADAVLALKPGGDIIPRLLAGIDFVAQLLPLPQYLAAVFTGSEAASSGLATIYWMVGVARAWIGIGRAAVAAVRQWGGFAQAVANAAADLMAAAAGGFPSLAVTLLSTLGSLLGNRFVLNIAGAAADELIALGNAAQADYVLQESENIGWWCSQNPGVCSAPLPQL